MSGHYADLIVADVDSFESLRDSSAVETRAALASLADVAKELGLDQLWARAEFVGLDRGEGAPGVTARLGLSMAWACQPGVGFRRNHYLHTSIPEAVEQLLANPRRQVGEVLKARTEEDAAIRGPEIAALRRIAKAATGRCPISTRVAVDIKATWDYGFDVAYRRRLAYALAYEASITTASFAPFDERLPALHLGSLEELAARLPEPSVSHAFSIGLNLLANLDRTVTYQNEKHDTERGVPDAAAKRDLLGDYLNKASRFLEPSLAPDGQIALNALLREVEIERELRIHNISIRPRWGSIAESQSYRTSQGKS